MNGAVFVHAVSRVRARMGGQLGGLVVVVQRFIRGGGTVSQHTVRAEIAKGGEVGKYTGYYYTASMAAQIVAPILSGALYDLFDIFTGGNGMRVVFFAFGTVFVALSFVTMFFVKHGDSKAEKVGALEALGGADD